MQDTVAPLLELQVRLPVLQRQPVPFPPTGVAHSVRTPLNTTMNQISSTAVFMMNTVEQAVKNCPALTWRARRSSLSCSIGLTTGVIAR